MRESGKGGAGKRVTMSAHRFATLVDLSSRMLQHIVSPEALVRRFKPQRTPLALKQTQRAPWVRCRADWALTFWTPTPPPALSPQPPRSARDRRWRAFQPLMQLGGALRPRSSAAPLHRASVAAARPHLPLQPAPRRGARGGPRELRGHLRPPRHRIRLPDLGPVGPLGPRARAAPFRGAGERALPPGPAAASPSPPGEAQAEAAPARAEAAGCMERFGRVHVAVVQPPAAVASVGHGPAEESR